MTAAAAARRGGGRRALLALLLIAATASGAGGRPLFLRDQGSFFVAGETVLLEHPGAGARRLPGAAPGADPPGRWRSGQAYVFYQIPARRRTLGGRPAPPIVLVHGCCLTGKTWETTPDGREGWATYFVRKGFPVYVLDQVGRGRSGFNPEKLNDRTAASPGVPLAYAKTLESAWTTFRLGPRPGVLFPGSRFPIEAEDQFFDEVVPDLNNWADGDQNVPTIHAVEALLDRIGPSILLVHSQSSSMGWGIAEGRPGAVRALIQIEGACHPDLADHAEVWRRTPLISVWGDYVTPELWGPMMTQCAGVVGKIRALGGGAMVLRLSEAGLPGHDHMLMLDHGNLEIADRLIQWLGRVLG